MALIDDLLNDIASPELRSRLRDEVAVLRRDKKFGLVFEQHQPELLCLPEARIYRGARVAHRNGAIGPTYIVESVTRKSASCRPEAGGAPVSLPLEDLTLVKRFGEPVFPAVAPVDSVSRGGASPHHMLIEADNYHALQLLDWLYAARVDCIYIDPPYNTGARDWKYNNDYVDLADGWRHSKWLAFMRRRLIIARRLLKPDGVLIVTIDEHEVHHLGMLLEEVMRGYVQQMVTVVINPKGTGKQNFGRVDEHAIFCMPDLGFSVIAGAATAAGHMAGAVNDGNGDDEDLAADTSDDDGEDEPPVGDDEAAAADAAGPPFPPDEAPLWELRHARRRGGESSYRHQRWRSFYPLWVDAARGVVVSAGESLPLDEEPSFETEGGLVPLWPIDSEGNQRCWRLVPASMQALIDEGRVVLGRYNTAQKSWTVNLWVRKASSRKLKTVWWDTLHDAGTHGTTLVNKILGRRDAFPFPKSVYAVRDAIAAVVRNRPHALVLDFFAGSGTALHAVAMLNESDGGQRQCILVTNNEVSDRRAQALRAEGHRPGDEAWEREGICRAVTWPRCRAVIEGCRPDGQPLDIDYPSGRFARNEIPRSIRALSFAVPSTVKTPAARKALAATLGVRQDPMARAADWYIAPPGGRDAVRDQAVLFDPAAASAFIAALQENGGHIRTIHVVMPDDKHFKKLRRDMLAALPPIVELSEEIVPMSKGLAANMDYLRLGFVDPDALEMGGRFSDLLPALWMMAGARGPLPTYDDSDAFIIPAGTGFAALIKEASFRSFNARLKRTVGVQWVFIVTDSREAFIEMSGQLPPDVPVRNRVHLYRNYLENFQINGRGGAA